MRLARENATKWHLKPGAIGMMGFSAGGHLAAMMGMIAPPDARRDFLDDHSVNTYPIAVSSILYFQRKITGSALTSSK